MDVSMKLMPASRTALRSLSASSSETSGPRGAPRSSIAPKPRAVSSRPVRPSVLFGRSGMLFPRHSKSVDESILALAQPLCIGPGAAARLPARLPTANIPARRSSHEHARGADRRRRPLPGGPGPERPVATAPVAERPVHGELPGAALGQGPLGHGDALRGDKTALRRRRRARVRPDRLLRRRAGGGPAGDPLAAPEGGPFDPSTPATAGKLNTTRHT